ncbi:uncharacterized protein LOC141841016 [Curcuma longa]|uniref:uncharacterized protein LOC141841016 n=1 Tax=Curcuma longa TaxID=136217 RepID=UPI003D9F4EEA
MSVWGKDHATGANAETPADAVEEINLCDEEIDTFEIEKEEYAEGHQDEEFDDDNQKISETSSSSVCPTNKKLTRKKKRKFDDALGDLVGEIQNYITSVSKSDEEISNYFKQQTENNHRKKKIYEELIELAEFSEQEIMDVGEYILKDEHKLDNFFALPKIFRRSYVVKLLSEIHSK